MSIQDEFISTVSHEMRTPLTSIRGFSQTLLASWDRIDDDNKKKFIKIIEEQSNRLIHLVENILAVSKANKAHNIIFTPQKELPPVRVDDDKLQQIMTNLIDNGGKYSKEGSTLLITTESKGEEVIIKVKDEGVGIREEDRDKLFKKFSRIENHLTSKTQGNGLGLYITKQLVESMHGQIDFESEENKGTTFTVKFPIYNEEEVLKCSQKS